MKWITALVMFLLVITPAFAITASLGSSRAVVEYELEDGGRNILERELVVRNVNDYPIEVTLEGDGDFKGIITFPANPVRLEPDTEKEVPFRVQLSQPGTLEGKINVYFRNAENSQEPPAALRATYIVLVSGEGQEVPEQPEPEQPENNTDAPRTFESNESGDGGVGISIGGDAVRNPPGSTTESSTNWFLISFLALVGILVVVGVIYIVRQ